MPTPSKNDGGLPSEPGSTGCSRFVARALETLTAGSIFSLSLSRARVSAEGKRWNAFEGERCVSANENEKEK